MNVCDARRRVIRKNAQRCAQTMNRPAIPAFDRERIATTISTLNSFLVFAPMLTLSSSQKPNMFPQQSLCLCFTRLRVVPTGPAPSTGHRLFLRLFGGRWDPFLLWPSAPLGPHRRFQSIVVKVSNVNGLRCSRVGRLQCSEAPLFDDKLVWVLPDEECRRAHVATRNSVLLVETT